MTSIREAVTEETSHYVHGISANIGQFLLQLLQVFFVGLTIGLQRNVVPALAEEQFGVPRDSFTLLMTFIISFGIVKGAMNLVAGWLSEKIGRRPVLLYGWLAAIPIPFMILYAPNWSWIVAANIALGINQGFAWSMTVTSKIDITKPEERGLATGINEFSGYCGVAIAGLITGYLAAEYDPRLSLFVFGLTVALIALATAYFFSAETLAWARAETAARKRTPDLEISEKERKRETSLELFIMVSYRHRTMAALSQAGCVEKFVDALVWAFFPVYLIGKGQDLVTIGWIVGIYGFTWGVSQLVTGPLSDATGRKWLIVSGMWICATGLATMLITDGVYWWSVAAAVTGIGMAMLYPTLIAAIGDISDPEWRGFSLGVYRFWRDAGYAIGAIAIGLVSDATGIMEAGFIFTAAAVALSGLWVLIMADETRPRPGQKCA